MSNRQITLRKVANRRRVERLMRSAISDLELNLTGINVLTEAASGPFAVTPLIAALSGSPHVVAIAKDSPYGSALEVVNYVREWAKELDIADRIEFSTKPCDSIACSTNLVTNLGFVRPIEAALIESLPKDSVIALMWEPWEFRDEDIDIEACRKHKVPVLGTNENHSRLKIFRYIGILALKLLLEAEIEVFGSRILIIGSGQFGDETELVLKANAANIIRIEPTGNWEEKISDLKDDLKNMDAVVVVEHKIKDPLIAEKHGLSASWLSEFNIPVIHICGSVDSNCLNKNGVKKIPSHDVPSGFMTLTTDYLGPRPVVDLHVGSLKACEIFLRHIREDSTTELAIAKAVESGLALKF